MLNTQGSLRTRQPLRQAIRPVLEQLEGRTLLSTTLNSGLLTIVGTPGDDAITIKCLPGGLKLMEVWDNGVRRVYSRAVVNSIKILGKPGNDRIEIDDSLYSLKKPAYIDGGAGNDTLIGASGADVIYGNDGNDLIVAQAGADRVWGGAGNDRILGGRGADLIDGGDGDDLINTGEDSEDGADGGAGANQINTGRAAMWKPQFIIGPDTNPKAFNADVTGLTPDQIRAAYGLDVLQAGNYKVIFNTLDHQNNFGAGQVITIIDAFYSNTIQADLDNFCDEFGLPKTTVEIVFAQGVQPAVVDIWAAEIALDVQWAHAIAPAAKIRLVLAETSLTEDLLSGKTVDGVYYPPAVDVAVAMGQSDPNGTIISMSFGSDEVASDFDLESHFNNDATRTITFVAASGDNAGILSHPGVSPHVVSVGGTELFVDDAGVRIAEEDAWEQGGGGISNVFGRPIYQDGITIGGVPLDDTRAVPDVAYNADPNSGVAVYNTTPLFGDSGWAALGGTSAGSPQWAGIIAIGNQLRTYLGRGIIGWDAHSLIYAAGVVDQDRYFYDITLNANANPALDGFDLATGWGSPRADKLVPALAGDITGALQMSANFTRSMWTPGGPRMIINFWGVGNFSFTKTEVRLGMAFSSDNGGTASLVINNPLQRVGKKQFGGYGAARVELDDGTYAEFTLRITGTVWRDEFGNARVTAEFFAIDPVTGLAIGQGPLPNFEGWIKGS
jgi:Ca2+-binding RTX toxin-like protein